MIDPAFGHWLAGLTDGEGCFVIHVAGHGFVSPRFRIKLRDDDREVLLECQRVLQIGSITYGRAMPTTERNTRGQVLWTIQCLADARTLVGVFDAHPLRSKKARDFAIWRRAVDVAESSPRGNRWHGPRDWSPMLALKAELENVRRYPETT